MSASIELNLEQLNDYIEEKCGGKEYFIGCWSAENFEVETVGDYPNIQSASGDNWVVLRNGADKVDGLVFPKVAEDDPEVTIFKGYLLEPALHSYSDGGEVRRYWSHNMMDRHNGIFSAVTITEGGEKLNIVTDIFGIGPIFARKVGKFVLFSNAPGLMSQQDDKTNNMSWVMRIMLGYVPGKETLTEGIEKVSPASVITYERDQVAEKKWYDYEDFPKGAEPYDDYTIDVTHDCFDEVIKRCLNIKNGKIMLPLSSGYDSRRIFAHLLDNKAQFVTATAQIPHTGGEDVDTVYGRQIAEDHNIHHTTLKMEDGEEWYVNRLRKSFCFDGLCDYHAWSVSFFNYYSNDQLCFYDGLLGDNFIFGDIDYTSSSFGVMPHSRMWFLKDEFCPSTKAVIDNYEANWGYENIGKNREIINYTLWQARNSTAYWAQLQTRPGQLVICPYADLQHVELSLRFRMEIENTALPQKDLLDKYWPELSKYPGTHEIPEKTANIRKQREIIEDYARKKLNHEKAITDANSQFNRMVSLKGKLALWLAKYIPFLRKKINWWSNQLPEMSYWWENRPFVIKIKGAPRDGE